MIGRKSFLVYFNQIFGAITGVIGMFFIARFMANPDFNYGLVNFALGFAGMFAFIGNIFNRAHVKRISEGQDEGTCMGTYLSLTTISVAIMLGLSFGGLLFWKHVLGRGFESQAHETVLYIILSFTALKLMGQIGTATFQAKSEIAKREMIRFMDYNVPTIFIIYVALTGGQAVELAYTYLTGGLLMLLTAVYFLKPIKIKKPNWKMAKSYWSFGLPSFFISLTGQLGHKLDIVMIQVFWSSVNVGYYAVSLRFSALLIGLSSAVVVIVFPTISGHHANSDWKSIKDLVTATTRYLSMIVTPIIFFLIVFPEQTITILLSRDFLPSVPVIRIMVINAFFIVLSLPFTTVFNGINKPKLGAKLMISCNLLNFGLNFLLIPQSLFGIPLLGLREVGAGIATLTSSVILLLLVLYFSKREAGTTPYSKIPIHLTAGIIVGILLLMMERHILSLQRYYHLALYGILFLGLYTIILWIIGEFTREDWNYIWDSLHPKDMFTYIKDEIKKD